MDKDMKKSEEETAELENTIEEQEKHVEKLRNDLMLLKKKKKGWCG